MTHLETIKLRLSNERIRLSSAKTDGEREMRQVWVAQIEKELADELAFLGKQNEMVDEMSDDELLAALSS